MRTVETRKIWLVAHPLHQYVENVKGLARQHHLKIYDSRVDVEFDPSRVEKNPPKLTKPGDKQTRKKKVDPVEAPEQPEE